MELTFWQRFRRASYFAWYWFKGADMRIGGRFHRWVWGDEESAL